jgi:transcriptional regulator with XRE-family HTH domain
MTTFPRSEQQQRVPLQHTRRQRRRNPDLSEFLRSRRARLSPADVGLAEGARRRTPGLRREEVAQLSGIGVTWYTWLEQGRPINASQQVLDAVARTLRLDATEREHLYHLAGTPLRRGPQALPQQVPPEVQTVLDALDPLPAVVYNARFDILAFNDAHEDVFDSETLHRSGMPNVLWIQFTTPPEENLLRPLDPDVELPAMVATLRHAYGSHAGDPAWLDFIERLSEASPRFAELWANGDVGPVHLPERSFVHARVGVLRLTSVSMAITGMPECRTVVFLAADEDTKQRLAVLREQNRRPGTGT